MNCCRHLVCGLALVLNIGAGSVPVQNLRLTGDLDAASNALLRVKEIVFEDGFVLSSANFSPTGMIVIYNITNNVTNLTTIQTTQYFQITTNLPGLDQHASLRFQARQQHDRLAFGKADLERHSYWYRNGAVDSNCWLAPVNFSGMSLWEQGQTISLITPRHGITCAHSPSGPGALAAFFGTDGQWYTNEVALSWNGSNDLSLVEFTNDFPAAVRPFALLPTNFPNWFEAGNYGIANHSYPLELVWYRPNTGKMNVVAAFSTNFPNISGTYRSPLQGGWFEFLWPSPPLFLDLGGGTGGDSGSPVFLLVAGEPCLWFALTTGAPSGPLLSWQPHFEWIQGIITNHSLRIVNLQRHTRYIP